MKGIDASIVGKCGSLAQTTHLVGSTNTPIASLADGVRGLGSKGHNLAILADSPAEHVVAVVPAQRAAFQFQAGGNRSLLGVLARIPVTKHIAHVADFLCLLLRHPRVVGIATQHLCAAAQVDGIATCRHRVPLAHAGAAIAAHVVPAYSCGDGFHLGVNVVNLSTFCPGTSQIVVAVYIVLFTLDGAILEHVAILHIVARNSYVAA